MIKAVIFDMNGVLVNDEPLHEQAFIEAFQKHGTQITLEDYQELFAGKTDKEGIRAAIERFGLSRDGENSLIQEKEQAYFRLAPGQLIPIEGVVDFVKKVKEKFTVALVTSATRGEVEMILKALNLQNDFALVITAEDISRGKPHPEPYLLAAQRLKLSPEECIVIEDSPAGVRSAQSAEMRVIAITTTHTRDELAKSDWIYDSFAKIGEKINRF